MATPIVLWEPMRTLASDDAGNRIIKTTLAPPVRQAPCYVAFDPERPMRMNGVPRLACFCIRALSKYPEQIHQLGSTRLTLDPTKGGADSILKVVLPRWKSRHFSLLDVHPGLWATLVQLYRDPPDCFSVYPCELSDPYVPLLNQIPSTPEFALLTVLDLTLSSHLTDDNILSLKVLHNLTALDVSNCSSITSQAILALSRTLTFNDLGEKRGPWGLRILRMYGCSKVDRRIFDCLLTFPLLCVVDLRYTSCNVQDIKRPFFSADDGDLFELPLNDAVEHLSQNRDCIYSNNNPFVLSLRNESQPSQLALRDASRRLSGAAPVRSHHNSFVVLPRSYGTTSSRRPTATPIQFGNVDENEFEGKRLAQWARQPRFKHLEEESEGHLEYDADEDPGGVCWDDETIGSSGEYEHEDNATESDSQLSSNPREARESSATRVDLHAQLDADPDLLFALRESSRRMVGPPNARSFEELLGVPITSEAQESEDRREEARVTASVETFYQRRPYTSPPRLRRRVDHRFHDLAILRTPPSWHTLDAIRPESQRTGKQKESVEDKGLRRNSKLQFSRKRKATAQVLQSELLKRRRSSGMIENADVALSNRQEGSSPPSPTSTVCDATEIPSRGGRPLQAISNFRPPPRASFAAPPRTKLDSLRDCVRSVETSDKGSPARFSAVENRGTLGPRDTTLVEGFKSQAQKPSASPFAGIMNRTPTIKNSSSEFEFLKRKRTAAKGKIRESVTKGKCTKGTEKAGTARFDWNRWTKS